MYRRFFGTHNTCVLYAIEMAKFEIEIHIEMATRLHAAYLGTVCNYKFHSMWHTGLLLCYQQSPYCELSCELTLYASGFIAYILCTILEEFCTIGITFGRCLLVHNNVCCVELTVYKYMQVPPNIQICCYTINKVL